jgi:polyhydroxyalkanoate synthesis regulator phasin
VGSNATITFGVDQGWMFYQTPDAPSISIAGWDWTTWSTGTGITYSTTGTSLDIAWDLRPFPQQDASTQMVQIRFNADVNPNNGAWIASVTANGPIPDQARFNYRETTNGTVTSITNTNAGTGFAGQISQGAEFTPYVDPNTSTVQAAVDAANATIFQLNASLSPVVAQNAINNSALSTLQSNINSLNNTVNSAVSTKTSLQTTLNTRATTLTNTINNNIPTPAPILAEPVIEGTTVTIAPELPEGYTANTWFYQVITDDPNAENPYEGQTLNTDGAPESIELVGLTEGATYTIRVANWSGPVSQYTETVISIPAPQSYNLTINNPQQTLPDETTPDEDENTETEPSPDENDESSEGDESQDTDTPESDDSSSNDEQDSTLEENEGTDQEDSQDNDTLSVEEIQEVIAELIADGNITAENAEEILEALLADGEITTDEVVNLSKVLSEDGVLTLAEKDLISDALVESADGDPISASDIEAAGLEYRDLPPQIPVEVRQDINGNPVVITAEVASALLVLENPAALLGAIATCFNPEEEIEGLTEEQKCELGKALLNIGADMSIPEREKAEDIVVVTIIAGQLIVATAPRRRR